MAEFLAMNSIDWMDFLHNSVRFCAVNLVSVGFNFMLLDSTQFPRMILRFGDEYAIFGFITISKRLKGDRLFSPDPKHRNRAGYGVSPCLQSRDSSLCHSWGAGE